MEGQTTCFVSGALAAVLRVSKYLGTAPLQFVQHGNGWRVSLSKSCSSIGYVLMILCNLCSLWIIISAIGYGQSGGRRVVTAIFFMSTLLSDIVVFGATRRMRCFISCLNQIKKARSELHTRNWPVLWSRKENTLFLFWVILSVTIYSVDYVLIVVSPKGDSSPIWLYALPVMESVLNAIITVSRAQFLLITLHVKTCFRAVNDCIRGVLRDIENNEVFEERSTYKAKNMFKHGDTSMNLLKSRRVVLDVEKLQFPYTTIRRASAAYALACDMVHAVNCEHGAMLLLMLALCLLQLIFKVYNIIINMVQSIAFFPDPITSTWFEVAQIAWCIYYGFNLVMLIEPCNKTHVEMENTRVLMCRVMCFSRSSYDPLTAELHQFFKQVTLNHAAYRPLHVTSMTRGLILSIISSIVTYVVILVDVKI